MQNQNQQQQQQQQQSQIPVQLQPLCGFLTIQYYQPYFNVDTEDVKNRMIKTLTPWKEESFLTFLGENIDAYGPFWITITLLFTVAVTSHFDKWMSQGNEGWVYDFQDVVSAASVLFGASTLCPLAAFMAGRQIPLPLTLAQSLCLYGYSLFTFIPAALLCLVPVSAVSWLSLLLAGLASAALCVQAVRPLLQGAGIDAKTAHIWVASIVVVQLSFALALKVLFYWQ